MKERKGWRMSCDVGKTTEWLGNESFDVGEVTERLKNEQGSSLILPDEPPMRMQM